jgi:hypothetical protein
MINGARRVTKVRHSIPPESWYGYAVQNEPPKIVDAEFEVVSPGRQAPAEYDRPENPWRRLLVWAAVNTDRRSEYAPYIPQMATWRVAGFLATNVVFGALFFAFLSALAITAMWLQRHIAGGVTGWLHGLFDRP